MEGRKEGRKGERKNQSIKEGGKSTASETGHQSLSQFCLQPALNFNASLNSSYYNFHFLSFPFVNRRIHMELVVRVQAVWCRQPALWVSHACHSLKQMAYTTNGDGKSISSLGRISPWPVLSFSPNIVLQSPGFPQHRKSAITCFWLTHFLTVRISI